MPDHAAEVQLVTSWDVAESKPGDRAEPSSREISITLAIVGTVALGFWIVVALVTRAPWIHPDEMIYADMARSIAAGELPTVRGAGASGFGVLYPLLVAPAWFFDDPDRAYAATRILNALLMTLTLIPAYFLAREFLPRTRSLIVGLLAVALPSLAYSAVVMTENVLYPVVVLGLLAMSRALARPSIGRQIGAFAALGLAVAAKPKAVILVAAYSGAILLYACLRARRPGSRLSRELSRYWLSLGILGAGAVAALLLPTLAFGRYSGAFGALGLRALPRQLLINTAEFDLFLAVAPFATSILVAAAAFSRRADDRTRLFAALLLPVSVAFLVGASAFEFTTVLSGQRVVNERNVFFIAPLFLIGFVLWLGGAGIRSRRTTVLVLVAAAVLPAVLSIYDVAYNAGFQGLALIPWLQLGLAADATRVAFVILGLGLVGTLLLPRRSIALPIVAVVTTFLVVSIFARAQMRAAGDWAAGIAVGGDTAWVDAAAGPGADVPLVWREPNPGAAGDTPVDIRREHRAAWIHEFFNRTVGDVLAVGRPMPYADQLPLRRVTVAADGTVLDESGRAVVAELVLARCSEGVDGDIVAVHRKTRFALYRIDGALRIGDRSSSRCAVS